MDFDDSTSVYSLAHEREVISPSGYLPTESIFSVARSEIISPEDSSRFTKNLVICILDECINELSILRSINLQNDLGNDCDKLLTYASIEDRYMGQENHADYRINAANNNFDKLAKDINTLCVVLDETCKEISTMGTFNTIEDIVRIMKGMYEEEEQLLRDEAKQEMDIEELKCRCEDERLENIRTIEETNAKIQALRFEVEDAYIYRQHEVQYFEHWELTRREQNMMKCKEKENFYQAVIKETREKMLIEDRCHNELEAYFEEMKNDYSEDIQQWMKRYDEDVDKREEETINLRTELEKIIDERKVSTEKYEKRQAEIDDYLEYKRAKLEKERQLLMRLRAATKIQAWWRGVMFRKKLGPYRKKKKKGDKKDKKKNKKK